MPMSYPYIIVVVSPIKQPNVSMRLYMHDHILNVSLARCLVWF